MNRNLRESLLGTSRNDNISNISAASNHHRGGRRQSLNGGLLFPRDSDDDLDLFSKNRCSLSFAPSDESSDVSVNLRRLSLGSAKVKGGLDDLLSSTDGGKHDYDWLLTPPGTPFFPSSEGSESQSAIVSQGPRSNSKVRSVSATKASRISVSQSESNHSTRPTKSSSVTQPSVSSYSNYYSNRDTSILKSRSASVSSYARPSSPITRSPSTARPTTASARSRTSRSSTPSKVRSSPNVSYVDKSLHSQSSRSSTPTSRPQIHANLNIAAIRANSRSSTPTRRNPILSPSSKGGASSISRLIVSKGQMASPEFRPSSPGTRVRPSQQPVVPSDFSLDRPANLRTTLPDRPISAGRSRPGGSVNIKAKQDTTSSINMPRRHSIGHASDIRESRKNSPLTDLALRKPLNSSTTTADSPGLGRTTSKTSLDMARKHTDTRNGTVRRIRPLSSTTLFPHSIQSTTAKTQSLRSFSASDSENSNGSPGRLRSRNLSDNGNNISRAAENGSNSHDGRCSAKLSDVVDIYDSSGYDIMLLKEDLKNMNWLHSIDDKADLVSISDGGFEPLPELVDLL